MFDLLNKGVLLINELVFMFDDRIGDRLVFRRDELFSVRTLEAGSLWDLKNNKAGVEAFFFDDENAKSDG